MDPNTRALMMGAAGAGGAEKIYVEDVFSTWLYTGNGTTQTITNGIDLSGKGGLVWLKNRQVNAFHNLFDTARGANNVLYSNTDWAQSSDPISSFNNNGFSLNSSSNSSGETYASWTFREAPKFFDVVTGTGAGTFNHSLGSLPGCVIFKNTGITDDWLVFHRGLSGGINGGSVLKLNTTAAAINPPIDMNVTATTFSTSSVASGTWVAYLFAHDAGGFGDSGNDSVVSCGSYTGNGSATGPTVTLGWEPQWLMIKRTDAAYDWWFSDNMRGMVVGGDDKPFLANASSAEQSVDWMSPAATGFQLTTSNINFNASGGTYIYIAIRRGPMKTPTDATKVFDADAQAGGGFVTTNFPVDLTINTRRDTSVAQFASARLTGNTEYLITSYTGSAVTGSYVYYRFDYNNGIEDDTIGSIFAAVYWNFRRAPGFFDVVAYTSPGGTPDPQVVNHNLGVAPALIIVKNRSSTTNWVVWQSSLGTSNLALDGNFAAGILTARVVGATSTTFSVGTQSQAGGNAGNNYIAYLFASCPGVSKVGTYTGTGTTLSIDCGFTNGSRLVLIKRTDSTGNWYIWDSARGIVSGNDPYLLLNSTAAEVTNTDYIDPLSSGFQISSTAPAEINANGGSYIFLAVA